MKKSYYIFFLFGLITVCTVAQSNQKAIIDDLNSSKWGQGEVKVMQDDVLQGKLAIYHHIDSVSSVGDADPNALFANVPPGTKVREYKIQVFMGNNQQKSKREAEEKQTQIKKIYPDMKTSVSFQSPFWRLRVGSFRTKEDAQATLLDMRKSFSSFGREMTVVSEVIVKR